jgi:putative tricarboxylic transport membrane protein
MALSTVGMAPIDSVMRYTFGVTQLNGGFVLLTICIGIYAMAEVLAAAHRKCDRRFGDRSVVKYNIKGFGFGFQEFKSQWWNCLRSGLIGTGIGILPGIGGSVSNMLAYSTAKNQSKYPEKFGTGIIDGIVASETANNATIGGAMIPLLTLGIPGDTVTAMMLGGFMLQGLTPGPLLFQTSGVFVYGIFAALLLSNLAMLIIERFGLKWFVKMAQVPQYILLSVIVTMCAVGAYGVNNRVFDVIAFSCFGLLGYVLRKFLGLP